MQKLDLDICQSIFAPEKKILDYNCIVLLKADKIILKTKMS